MTLDTFDKYSQRRYNCEREHNSLIGESIRSQSKVMKLKVVIHGTEEDRHWSEVSSIAGCAAQDETFEELFKSIYETIEGCLFIVVMR